MFNKINFVWNLPIAEKHCDFGARRHPHNVTGSFFSAFDEVVEKHNEGLCGLDEVLLPIKLGTWRGGLVFIFVCILLGVNFVFCLLVRMFTLVGPWFHTVHLCFFTFPRLQYGFRVASNRKRKRCIRVLSKHHG